MSTDWPFGQPDTFGQKIRSTDFKGAVSASGIAKQTPDQKAAIEAVMFALWAQGKREKRGVNSFLAIISLIAGLAVNLFLLPLIIIRHLSALIIGATVVLTVSYALDWSLTQRAQIGFFIIAVLVLFKDDLSRWVRDLIFDFGDVILNGALTRRYINRHFLYGPVRVFEDPDGLKRHLTMSRPLMPGPYHEETLAFQEIVAGQIDDWPSLQAAIDGFWRVFPRNQHYWRERRAGF